MEERPLALNMSDAISHYHTSFPMRTKSLKFYYHFCRLMV